MFFFLNEKKNYNYTDRRHSRVETFLPEIIGRPLQRRKALTCNQKRFMWYPEDMIRKKIIEGRFPPG